MVYVTAKRRNHETMRVRWWDKVKVRLQDEKDKTECIICSLVENQTMMMVSRAQDGIAMANVSGS